MHQQTPVRFRPVISACPHLIHGADYNPDQWIKWKDTIWKEDMRLAKEAGINELSIGIFSWAMLEPAEGEYHFEWLDEVMDMLADAGITAILATPSGARPPWMAQAYPEVLRTGRDLRRIRYSARHNHCLTSPVYREKVRQINTLLARRYANHPALGMWHISNEYGGACYCEMCLEKFRQYLKARYQTLDALNEAWWGGFWAHLYTDWSQIEAPSKLGEGTVHGQHLDWMRFTTDQYIDFYQAECAPLREFTPEVPITTNFMRMEGHDDVDMEIDYFRLARELDVVSWDNYPQWRTDEGDEEVACQAAFMHDLFRGMRGGQPFLLMESSPSPTNWQPVARLSAPGGHKLHSLQAVAHGSDSVQYFQFRKSRGSYEKFHGAVVDHEGSNRTRVFREVADTGAALAKLDAVVGTTVPAQVALLYDWENRWALRDAKFADNVDKRFEDVVREHYRALWHLSVPVEMVDEESSLDKFKLVIAPMAYLLKEGFANRLMDFTRAGGQVVLTYMSGYVDQRDLVNLGGFPGPLKELAGIWDEELDTLYPDQYNQVTWQGKTYRAQGYCTLVHLEGARALAAYEKDFYAGYPALTVNDYGQGRAYYMACRLDDAFLMDFYRKLTASCGISPVLPGALPRGVSAMARTDGEREYVFLMNFSHHPQRVDVGAGGARLLGGGTWQGEIELEPQAVEVLARAR
ncbi:MULTISPECIES: beta-galactosidase [unclassified Clostridium]|uniref:beta-galactosidase n=1 Tax=unclassified Clostridium TaxID=2614128 RepID=UPI0011072563|nr:MULTISPECIES: beta-galactosidase [unclassified Clostridium]